MTRIRLVFCVLGLLITGTLYAGNQQAETSATDLKTVNFEQWDEVLSNDSGQISVVDFWASWCAPCITRFPHMVEMHHRYKDRGVRFISLNLDDHEDEESVIWANEFLAREKAVFANYHLNENMFTAFERLDLLGIPAVRIYAADGTELHRLSGDDPNNQFTEKDVENAILGLLAD